ncbi:MAG: Glycine oxidase [uncultured Sphingomonadaceae bacterium]|uniref:Glycine oxidase n=1 Tax=uncultured Sphingomonadaceae bacterium TaxID=169976 RepID=A0A6J4S972_9SPHN|nr:MAG: Glycine oxidase [uncultured Sphingomonadaceae bacterium]
MIHADVAIVGGGMAGASLAAELVAHRSVLLIEGESHPGYHATGRSAAFWTETYGGPHVQPLTTASGPFLRAPPPDFADAGFLRPRGAVHLSHASAAERLDAFERNYAGSSVALSRLAPDALRAAVPGIRADWTHGLSEPSCADIDVASLHAAYLRAFRRGGGRLLADARVSAAERGGDGWCVAAGGETIACAVLVDAAGAWADDLARLAGVRPLGLSAYRRTIVQLRVDPPAPAELPLVIDVDGRFYFKGEAGGRIWLSPHDETPCAPGDAAAEEIDVALAIDRLQRVVDWRVDRVERSWAGLRTFAPDRLPVYGYDARADGFFWCAGQGGFGIQTAPAAAKLAAALLLRTAPDDMVNGIEPHVFRPKRFG